MVQADDEFDETGVEILKEGMLLKRRDFLPKWEKRLFVIEMDFDSPEKQMQLVIKFYTTTGDTPLKTKSLYGAKIRLSDSNKVKSDSGRFDLIFPDGDRYRLNAKDQFDRQDWVDEIVTILQDFSEDPLDMEDIVENQSVTSKEDIESSLNGSLRSPRQSEADMEEQRRARKGNLKSIPSGMEYAEVQDVLNKRIKGRSKSQKEKLVKREKSKKRLERTLSSLSGSNQEGSNLRRSSFKNSSRQQPSRQNSIREEIEPGTPRDIASPALSNQPPRRRPSVARLPSLVSAQLIQQQDLNDKSNSLPTSPGRSPGFKSPALLSAIDNIPNRRANKAKKSKSDVGSMVRKTISGNIRRFDDDSFIGTATGEHAERTTATATPSSSRIRRDGSSNMSRNKIRSAMKDKSKPQRRKTVQRGVSFQKAKVTVSDEIPHEPASKKLNRSVSLRDRPSRISRSSSLRVPSFSKSRHHASRIAEKQYQETGIQHSPRDMHTQHSIAIGEGEPLFGQTYFQQQGSQKVPYMHQLPPPGALPIQSPRAQKQDVDAPIRGKKWDLLKNVLHLMPHTKSSDKVKEFIFGDIPQDSRMSYDVPAINEDVNELDLFVAVPETGSLMVASVHEHYLRAKEFVSNNEAVLTPDAINKFLSYGKMIDSLTAEAPAAAIAAQSFYTFEVTRTNPYWCATGMDGAAMRVGFASPQSMIVELLRRPTLLNLMMLKECMSYSSPEWIQMFYKLQGSEALFEVIGLHMGILKSGVDEAIDAILQALLCLQALIATKRGMELAIADEHFVTQLLLVLELDDTDSDVHKMLSIIMLQSIMLYDGDGYHRVLESVLQPKLTEILQQQETEESDTNKENSPLDLTMPLPSLNLDDMSQVKILENEEFLPPAYRSHSMTRMKINASCVRTLVGLLDSDKNDLDMDLCVHVIKFLQAMMATAETLEERKLRKQLVHALSKCEIYSVLELLTTDLALVDTAIQDEIDDLKMQITAVLNEIIEDVDEETIDITDEPIRRVESQLSLKPHEVKPHIPKIPIPPPLPPKLPLKDKAGSEAAPPPPASKKGVMPPPPPGGMEAKYTGPKPHLKMKSLFWDKIPPARLKATFWEQFANGGYEHVDFKEVEKLFQAMVRRGVASGSLGKNMQKKLKVLDIKRATTIGILLNKFPVPWHKIKYTAISLDSSIYTCADDVHALLDCLPKEEEINKIEAFLKSGASHDGLSEAELVCIDLYQIPRADTRLRTFHSMFVSLDRLSEVTKILEAHSQAMRQLQTSRVMRVVLQMILALGNFMNYGTRLGNAMGFRLKCLSKLQDTRSLDGKHSLLSYIAQQVCKQGYPILSDEIPSLVRAELKTCLKDVNEMFNSVKEAILQIEAELKEQPTRVFVVFDLDYSAYNFQSTATPRENSFSTIRSLEDITEVSEASGNGSSEKPSGSDDPNERSITSTPVPSGSISTPQLDRSASNANSLPQSVSQQQPSLQSQESARTPRKMADIFAMWERKTKAQEEAETASNTASNSDNSPTETDSQKGNGSYSAGALTDRGDSAKEAYEDQLRLERLDAATYVQVDLLVDNYQDIMTDNLLDIKRKLKHLMDKLKTCMNHFERLLGFYGEKSQNINEEDFWGAVITFVERLSQHQRGAYRDLKEEIERRKRSLRRQLDRGSIEGRMLSDMEIAMSHVLQEQGVTDLDAQVEAIMIQEFGVERLSLGASGPEASKRAMLMRVFANTRKELEKDQASEEKKDKLRRASESAISLQEQAQKKESLHKGVNRRRTIREGSLLNKNLLARNLMKSKSAKTRDEHPGMEQHLHLMSIEEPQESPTHQRAKTEENLSQVELGMSPSNRNRKLAENTNHIHSNSMENSDHVRRSSIAE